MKKVALSFGLIVLGLVVVIAVKTLVHTPDTSRQVKPIKPVLDEQKIAERLSQAIAIKTISSGVDDEPGPEFEQFINWMQSTYPAVFSQLKSQRVGPYSLLLEWSGSQQQTAPILLSAHYDVVPIAPETEHLWQHPPFEGHIDKQYIWGRGALDDKSAVIGLLEALSLSIAGGFQPQRTIYISLTHDEELGSANGAALVTDYLIERGVKLDWSLDEGSFVLDSFIPGIEKPVVSINVAEKGFLTIELSAQGKGGHSSMPPAQTTVGILSAAISKLQDHKIAGGLDGLSAAMFDALSRHMPVEQKVFFANQWLFGGILEAKMSQVAFSNALLRTTTAPTMFSAGIKDNVLPIHAKAVVNFRLHPRDTSADVVTHIESVVDDPRVKIHIKQDNPASRASSYSGGGFDLIAASAQAVYGEVVIAPGITIGGTDSSQYERVANNSYRFNPMMIVSDDLAGFHGTNERISIANMAHAVMFYQNLMERSAGKQDKLTQAQ